MATKPYEALLERVKNGTAEQISPNNQKMLEEFLTIEHPGDVLFTKWSFPPILKSACVLVPATRPRRKKSRICGMYTTNRFVFTEWFWNIRKRNVAERPGSGR